MFKTCAGPGSNFFSFSAPVLAASQLGRFSGYLATANAADSLLRRVRPPESGVRSPVATRPNPVPPRPCCPEALLARTHRWWSRRLARGTGPR